MASGDNAQSCNTETDVEIKRLQLQLLISQETTQQKRLDATIEKRKLDQKKQDAIIEERKLAQRQIEKDMITGKIKILQLEKRKRDDDEYNERIKMMKRLDEEFISISSSDLTSATHNNGYYDIYVKKNLYRLEIETLLNDNTNVNDDMINIFEKHFVFKSLRDITEKDFQSTFVASINELFAQFNVYTSLKYLSTDRMYYLNKYTPDCTFIYKNININMDDEYQALQDFTVCIGELKVTKNGSIENLQNIGQLARYLDMTLKVQNRDKIYGFLTNLQYITFYCVEKTENPCFNKYYQSNNYEMFYMPRKASSSIDGLQPNQESKKICLNKDTMKLLIKFLTMNKSFYEYTTLNIDPNDKLFDDNFYIKQRLGNGITSMAYLIVQNDFNQSPTNSKSYVIKISKNDIYDVYFINEVDILKQLKQSDKYELYDPCTVMFFYRNKHIMIDLGTGNNNKISWALEDTQEFIDIVETVYRGARKGRGLVISPKDYSTKYRY
ncbi:unnamed protein product [Rotaria sp. Silwood1]|nr:unnamed protein product [Rotaria sp. Silwood1]